MAAVRFGSHALAVVVLVVCCIACTRDREEAWNGPVRGDDESITSSLHDGGAVAGFGHEVVVAAGVYRSCALRKGRTPLCWGSVPDAEFVPPRGTYQQISVGENVCGLDGAGSVICWGENPPPSTGDIGAPSGAFTQVSTGASHACGVRSDGSLSCWGDVYRGAITPPGQMVQASCGAFCCCAVDVGGGVSCWGATAPDQILDIPPTDSTYVQVSVGFDAVCALTTHQSIECWMYDVLTDLRVLATWPIGAPTSSFVAVSSGGTYSVGLDEDGARWTAGGTPDSMDPSLLRFESLSLGSTHGCGVTLDGYVSCWGDSLEDWYIPPSEVAAP